jgi:hypothetical protein
MNIDMNRNEEDARLQAQLQRAVHSTAVPPYLESRIRATIRGSAGRRAFRFRWAVAAAALVISIVGGSIAYRLRTTAREQDTYIATVSNQVASIMRAGLRDHIHCAVFRKLQKTAQRIDEIEATLKPPYRPMIPVVRKHVPRGFQLMLAHECRYQGRRFVHLALQRDAELLSVVLTRKENGESFQAAELIPALHEAGLPLYRTGVQRFRIAAFESRMHLVYVISDLPEETNTQTLRAMVSELNAILVKIES